MSTVTPLLVTPEEHGMKLLRFLERRLANCPPKSVLHRWIRTGQVRINKGRAKPFTLLCAHDAVRVPPFATQEQDAEHITAQEPTRSTHSPLPFLGGDLPILAATPSFFVLNKPGRLAVQPGTGQDESVVSRLCSAFARHLFVPAPAHRIDRHTSGLLLVGRTHAALRQLHELFASPGALKKEYLAWIAGEWPYSTPYLLQDSLTKEQDSDGRERMHSHGHTDSPYAKNEELEPAPSAHTAATIAKTCTFSTAAHTVNNTPNARCVARPLRQISYKGNTLTLLHVHLLTGRTHQIRVQLAVRGFPILGDGRYGGSRHPKMLLHSMAITLPDGVRYQSLPDWQAPFEVSAVAPF